MEKSPPSTSKASGFHRPFPVDNGFQPGVTAALPSLRRGLGEEVGVEIVVNRMVVTFVS